MTFVVELEDIVYAWPGQEPCLDIPEFRLLPGERVFLHGPSGAGKSTLLNLIGGVLTPRSGRLRILGRDWTALGSSVRDHLRAEHIGFIFQQFNLIPYLSALENVILPCHFSDQRANRAKAGTGNLKASACRLLEHLNLDSGLWSQKASALSVGQQQRVAAARALIGLPELVVADEPTSALDEGLQSAFLNLLRNECDAVGSTLLFVSHDQRMAGHFQKQLGLSEINLARGED